ncbi:tRNA glutamyl-Q(34) synthetase GluQRS [Amphritea pacifica]|uniref:Glutamyl-Q tRNA(Asp) synthetase n=1 Tax=Amphritea pacifica TaxID=2811233 RepID=A0ABS2WC97_9GAMM|nr:tRNA glutamyl-Q(34) synthetase GluQRS [Amphritea pacifica]MBN0989203.1 tRNA glutamyl-Q(34) synthetase GluQRS [Amphritea pacifica]MBN1008566.1 tRNA glutamyl-Q(34) synthetase GluQRS [Amphritea pacifica]
MVYTGRFAPSPTGPLHFGSLLAAIASYLDARAHKGRWLLRIEDLDPPREVEGASDSILKTLEQFGLHWDGEVIRQSDRYAIYSDILSQLIQNDAAYRCGCSRQQIRKRSGGLLYDRYCRNNPPATDTHCAIRSRCDQDHPFYDRIQGHQQFSNQVEDFVIFRRDGFFAYQLAVTIDDAAQQISHIVRGSDLLDSTPKQIQLQQQLGYPQPVYAHIPVATNIRGQKLSKQTLAPALDEGQALQLIIRALDFLGQQPVAELTDSNIEECLSWASAHWDITAVPNQTGIILEDS